MLRVSFQRPWAFEYTPASSEPVDQGYLRKVREADLVIWLASDETTTPVANEIREALASDRRLLIFRLAESAESETTRNLLREVGMRAKYKRIDTLDLLAHGIEMAIGDEITRALRGKPGLSRLARLDELWRESIGRCMSLWQAVGVDAAVARRLAEDATIGKLPEVAEGLNVVLLVG